MFRITREDDSNSFVGRDVVRLVYYMMGIDEGFERKMKSGNSTRDFECVETLFTTFLQEVAFGLCERWSTFKRADGGPPSGKPTQASALVDYCEGSNAMVN